MQGRAVSRGTVSRGQRPRQPSQLQSKLCFAGSVFPLFTTRQSQDTLPSLSLFSLLSSFSCCRLRTENETKCHAIPVPLLSLSFFPSLFETCGLPSFSPSFTPSLCSQATTQLKWFAAAKKISLFSSHSRSLAAPPSSPLSLSLTHSHVLSLSLTLALSPYLPPCSLAVCV